MFSIWCAIDSDDKLIGIGIVSGKRFSRYILKLGAGGYFRWVHDGARYCRLLYKHVSDLPLKYHNMSIKELDHGPIRRCKSVPVELYL